MRPGTHFASATVMVHDDSAADNSGLLMVAKVMPQHEGSIAAAHDIFCFPCVQGEKGTELCGWAADGEEDLGSAWMVQVTIP